MTIPFTRRSGVGIAAALVLGAALLLPAAQARSADRGQLAQASPPASAPAAQPSPPRSRSAARLEARIKSLHDQLKLTAAQEPQWSAVAQVMRDNAKAVSDLVRDRAQKASSMTAVDDLRSYAAVADAHAAGVRKLIPAFDALYATLSDDQKKNADAVFRHRPRRAAAKRHG